MRERIDCFFVCETLAAAENMAGQLRDNSMVAHSFLLVPKDLSATNVPPKGSSFICIEEPTSSNTITRIAENAVADYALLCLAPHRVSLGQHALQRMYQVASDAGAALLYTDRYTVANGQRDCHPVIDYQEGSLRDDFDFGSLLLVNTELLRKYAAQAENIDYRFAGLYDLRLFISRNGSLFHLNEYLYTEQETDTRQSGVKQFDYVNPANRDVQLEMEKAATAHLAAIGALVDTSLYDTPDFDEQPFGVEATVVIPVRNREKTIVEAINSALSQETRFAYNVIVVDNHSTDRTTELIDSINDERLIHVIPTRTDLGIGGCWNVAINDERCGRFTVQLDSDDLYSSPTTLQTIVKAFHEQKAAMIVGSYRMCDFNLNTLPPGLIAHKEWTDKNGPNNALRINGLGAPRAFFTPLLRQIQFPNTSYGEDYAMGLAFSRRYRIGRIYDELYLCRRWGGNSDAALSTEKINANNLYKDRLRTIELNARRKMGSDGAKNAGNSALMRFFNRQMETWPEVRSRYNDLRSVNTRDLQADSVTLTVQYNPARMVSTGAKIDRRSLSERPCFLCDANRPNEQMSKVVDGRFELLVNPFPILPTHFTIPSLRHEPQRIADNYGEILRLLRAYPDMTVFYNGPRCGASAPDHCHVQMGESGCLPLQRSWQRLSRNLTKIATVGDEGEGIYLVDNYPCAALLIASQSDVVGERLFNSVYSAMNTNEGDSEPMMNIVAWRNADSCLSVVFPRGKHRPDCYYAAGGEQMLVSPGALDMAGLFITPREEDFNRLSVDRAIEILKEVSIDDDELQAITDKIKEEENTRQNPLHTKRDEPQVSVGIVSGQRITFSLNNPYTAKGETIVGEQVVEFSEGGILWRGTQYRELTFAPQASDASFSLHDVTIGVNFHWERQETQVFNGTLSLVVEADRVTAINILPVERYLASVISSEMKATSSLELLKAHAVISRSWLLAQMDKRRKLKSGSNNFFSFMKKDDELIRWYDREDHTIFDVCADDHCQRYHGITTANSPTVERAVGETRGRILTYDGEICDARFSKCCGGATEEFQYCWENTPKPYLIAIHDNSDALPADLSQEADAERWIRSVPPSFCNTADKETLSQVLNDYDQETPDFYRWQVAYTQDELSALVNEKTKDDFGQIVDLVPLERGRSGRICRLEIVGTKKTMIIGKELEIRRTLSRTHLYSSAFVVDKMDIEHGVPQRFVIHGAGWGHGVGLCQIGAAVMGQQGYTYDQILLHYYRGATIERIY